MMIGNNGMIEGGGGGRSIMSLLVSIVLIKLKAPQSSTFLTT